MKRLIPVTLIVVGGQLIAAPATYSFILRWRGLSDSLPSEVLAPCTYGGFSLVVGGILLAVFSGWLGRNGKVDVVVKTPPSFTPK